MQYDSSLGNRGQSLVEILVAVGLGALFVIAAASIIAPALRINTHAERVQVAGGLAKELTDGVRVWAESDWHNILNLATTSANAYYLIASSSPFTATSGIESVAVATTTYSRYFYVDDVARDSSGYIATSSGSNDPSTKLVTVGYNWPQGTTTTFSFYLTRYRNNVFSQTDWFGGAGQEGPATTTNSRFASSSVSIAHASTTGSLTLALAGGGGGGGGSGSYVRAFRAGATSTATSASTTHTVALPAGFASGDLLLVSTVTDGTSTITWPAGWSALCAATDNSAITYEVRYRVSNGTEGATISVTTGESVATGHWAARIVGHDSDTNPPRVRACDGDERDAQPALPRTLGWFERLSLDRELRSG